VLTRVLRGDPRKVSRFHDFAGNAAPLAAYARLPTCIASTLIKKVAGRHPAGPWLGYRGIRRLADLLRPTWQVLEFGAGNSTRWLADRVAKVVSIEGDPAWYGRIAVAVARRTNVNLILQPPPYDAAFAASLAATFDFCLVDGLARDRAMELALSKVAPGGFVYLDNADVQDDEHQRARRLLLARCEPASVEIFIDFFPGQITVSQGILGRVPRLGRG